MRTIIIAALLLAANLASAQYTHPERIGIVGQLTKWELKPTGVLFTAGPIWWNPKHEQSSPQSEWQIEYNWLLKWEVNGQTQSTTIKTWDISTFWKAPAGVKWITYTVKAIPHHKPGKHTSGDSFTCGAYLYLSGIFKVDGENAEQ